MKTNIFIPESVSSTAVAEISLSYRAGIVSFLRSFFMNVVILSIIMGNRAHT